MLENLEQIKRAIEVEVKHRYIDIRGKTSTFSKFIKSEILKEIKKNKKNLKWQVLFETFDRYPTESVNLRQRAINRLISVIKSETLTLDENSTILIKPPSQTDVMYIKGVGPKLAYIFNKLGIYTAQDLLFYFPRKHIDYSTRTKIKDLKENDTVTIFGTIKSTSAFNSKRGLGITKVKIADETGNIELSFFNAKSNRFMLERIKAQFPLNAGIMLSGCVKLNKYDGKLTIDKPQYSIMTGDFLANTSLNLGRIVPIYPLGENLNIKTLRKAIFNAIALYKPQIKTILPDFLIKKYKLMEKAEAVEQIHFPTSIENLEQARFSLVFEELFIIQLKLARLRENVRNSDKAVSLKVKPDGLVMNFIKNLPFELTGAQKKAVNEILNDLNSEEPMQRLLQGDVGSGKTVVASIMLLAAIENGYQSAIMAPTEILAQQHFNNLISWLTPLGLNVGLFLGSKNKKSREIAEKNLQNGQTNIAVGTHALIQDNVQFSNLGAIVIDEQHRFGVKQRGKLKMKAQNPQMLTMTATPIPRTLALTIHGDLDLTIIDEMPKGRKPIKTYFATTKKAVYDILTEEINNFHQAYIVYPLIDESETLSAKAATIEAERLQREVFPNYKIGLLHGKLKNDEKEKVMNDFKNHKYDILVSTTVVEVGVDVPNATVMVVENAERFGLSQLHQLRGRVGRSELQSYCILCSNTKSQETKARLNIMCETNDGFVIAEKDLELRGPGEFLGTRQSGLPDLIISDIVRDAKILEDARGEAIDFVKNNDMTKFPQLNNATGLDIWTDFT